MKRAANRKSAQLSRKRKKLYIEELKEQNAVLQRQVSNEGSLKGGGAWHLREYCHVTSVPRFGD